jgi:hypothetical protein
MLTRYARVLRGDTLLIAAIVLASTASAQAPDTEIFLIPVTTGAAGPSLGDPTNVTNRTGYDNQPNFTPDGRAMLFTSVREGEQADIYRYDIASGAITRVTATAPESEYSAAMIPGEQAISVVRVERDSAQRLWRFPLDGGAPSVLVEHVRPVGYYAWGDVSTLFMFVLGEPPTLQRAARGAGAATVLADSIGRSLQRIPGGGVSVVLKESPDEWWITRVDLATNAMERLVRTRPGQEDHAWMPDGSLVMAEGATVYRSATGGEWTEMATFTDPFMARLTRLAVSPDGKWLAIVGMAAAAPER